MPMNEWNSCIRNIRTNPSLSKMLFAEWMFIQAGIPFHGDFAFFGLPEKWIQYGTGIDNALKTLCTRDKHHFSEQYHHVSHWAWNKINNYTKNDWLSFAVTWPNSFASTLIRDENFVYNKTFKEIEQRYKILNG